jgi:hypothetical protein
VAGVVEEGVGAFDGFGDGGGADSDEFGEHGQGCGEALFLRGDGDAVGEGGGGVAAVCPGAAAGLVFGGECGDELVESAGWEAGQFGGVEPEQVVALPPGRDGGGVAGVRFCCGGGWFAPDGVVPFPVPVVGG